MPFSLDRDLLVLEPNLWRDLAFAGQRVVTGADGVLAGTTLTSAGSDFLTAGAEAGQVALVAEVPVEVTDVLSATVLEVSRLRADREGALLPPAAGTGLSFSITTFAPQRTIVHTELLRALGLDPDDEAIDPVAAVLTVSPMILLESLGVLAMLFAAASGMAAESDALWTKSLLYRERFSRLRASLTVRLDLDGDGIADAERTPGVLKLTR